MRRSSTCRRITRRSSTARPYHAYPPVYVPPPPGYAVATGLAAGLAFGAGIAISNALWGSFDRNNHNVNINVNRYNNINVNNRINANTNTTNWNRNTNVNRNTANLNRTQNNLGATDRAQRDAYRGRDDPRAQARQTLQTRTGQDVSGSASQRLQDIRQGGGTSRCERCRHQQRGQPPRHGRRRHQ